MLLQDLCPPCTWLQIDTWATSGYAISGSQNSGMHCPLWENQSQNLKCNVSGSGIQLTDEHTLSKDIYKCISTPTIPSMCWVEPCSYRTWTQRKFKCAQTQEIITQLKDASDVKYAEKNRKDSTTHSVSQHTSLWFFFSSFFPPLHVNS